MEVDFKCRICGMEFASVKGLGLHIRQIHAMLSKEYYDKFYRQPGEGYVASLQNFTACRRAGISVFVPRNAPHVPKAPKSGSQRQT